MADITDLIDGSEKLTEVFGNWPSFHDAEVVELRLWRGNVTTDRSHPIFPVLTTKIHLWQLTNEVDARGYYVLRHHTLATIRFHDVLDLEIKGFNPQNVIYGLSIESQKHPVGRWKSLFKVRFEPVGDDFEVGFRCSGIEVLEAVPWDSAHA